MKYITLIIGLLVVGCGKTEPIKELTPEQKQKALRDSVVGEYEFKDENGNPYTFVFLENGVREYYLNGNKRRGDKWSIVDGEIHIEYNLGLFEAYRKNTDKSITQIAYIEDGKRTALKKEQQTTYKKIK